MGVQKAIHQAIDLAPHVSPCLANSSRDSLHFRVERGGINPELADGVEVQFGAKVRDQDLPRFLGAQGRPKSSVWRRLSHRAWGGVCCGYLALWAERAVL